jgi:sialate O-acetylesterase
MNKHLNLVALFFISGLSLCFSQTKMPSFFSDNMMLQQQDNVAIWGTDKPRNMVQIQTSWGVETSIMTDENGKWETKIPTKKASFINQVITVKGSSTILLKNVLIGEVWFASGQSNMEMPLHGFKNSPINNSEEFINSSNNSFIRLFNTNRSASLSLEHDVNGTWEASTIESAQSFSALGYMFARKLFDELQIPIGIIEASWGGTPIECWLPETFANKYPNIKIPDSLPEDLNKQKKPTLLYNAMIHPFKNYSIKGFLWYQGESNRKNAGFYKDYMHTLVNSWRTQWQQDELPFYFVQIAPYGYEKYRDTRGLYANLIREAQSFAAKEISNSGVVITTDVGKCDEIHPPEKYIIAKRLANWALAKQYSFKDMPYRSPEYKSMKVKRNKAMISFDFFGTNKENRKINSKREFQNFVIAGADKIFYPAEVKVKKNKKLIVYSDKVKNPVAVRYGFVDCLEGSLFSNSGLPVSPFRTDDWND